MRAESTDRPVFDLSTYLTQTFKTTFLSSRRRRIISMVILICQFILPFIIRMIFYDERTSISIENGEQNARLCNGFVGIVKYSLLLALILKSPLKMSCRPTSVRLIFLGGFFWFYFWIDMMSGVFTYDETMSKVAQKSFEENKQEIYARVLFTSYKEDTNLNKQPRYLARPLNPRTNGYVLIVHIDSAIYRYRGLKEICRHFNSFAYPAHIYNLSPRKQDIPFCLFFAVSNYHQSEQKVPPSIPLLNQYVKVLFDPVKYRYELETDSATLQAPVWDTMPKVVPTNIY